MRALSKLHGASLELGGKNPMIVLDDVVPSKAAADAVYACFSSMGQLCVSIERIYVDRAVADGVQRHHLAPAPAFRDRMMPLGPAPQRPTA